MKIGSVANGLTGDPATASVGAAPGKDEFLKLLVAQIQHQDPLQPQDGAAFVAQLAQFASLEESTETNSRLASLEATESSIVRLGYSNLVGKTVTTATDGLDLPSSGSSFVHLDRPAGDVAVDLYDETGRKVRTITLGPRAAGDVPVEFDGKDDSGAALPPGRYSAQIRATDSSGAALGASLLERGRVTAVEFDGGSTVFRVGNRTISPADILSVEASPGQSGSGGNNVDLDFLVYGLERSRGLR